MSNFKKEMICSLVLLIGLIAMAEIVGTPFAKIVCAISSGVTGGILGFKYSQYTKRKNGGKK